jgi:hypothetical protein
MTFLTTVIQIRIDGEVVGVTEYESVGTVPIPELGDFVLNPNTNDLAVAVVARMFDYREGRIIATLDC